MNELEKVLVLARSRVSQGWCQNHAQLGTRVCAGHAMVLGWKQVRNIPLRLQEWPTDELYTQMVDTMMEAISEMFPLREWHEIPHWNDQQDRTQQEVIDTFDRALKLAERDG